MYAIVEVGSRQFKVAKDDEILIEKAIGPRTHKFSLDKVLLVVNDKQVDGERPIRQVQGRPEQAKRVEERSRTTKIGNPYLKETKVNCEVISHQKGKKVISFKWRRRKDTHCKKGYRAQLVLVKIKDIAVK